MFVVFNLAAGGGDSAISCDFCYPFCVAEIVLVFVPSSGSSWLSLMMCTLVTSGADIGVLSTPLSLLSLMMFGKLVHVSGISFAMLLLLSLVDLMSDICACMYPLYITSIGG